MIFLYEFLTKKKQAIIRCFFTILLFFYGVYFQYIPVYLFHIDLANLDGTTKVLLSAFSSAILLLIFAFMYRKDLEKEFAIFRKNFMECMDTGVKCWLAGLGIMMVANILITVVFQGGGANNEKAVQSMIHSLPWLMVVNAGFIAPINEEIVFRKSIKDVFGKWKWLFIILSFLLFGGAHVMGNIQTWKDALYIIPYGALGAAFAAAYHKTKTVFTPISFHMIHNTILICISLMML